MMFANQLKRSGQPTKQSYMDTFVSIILFYFVSNVLKSLFLLLKSFF